jgi:predicted RNase H-like nuclease (RuvC/YqgF family)
VGGNPMDSVLSQVLTELQKINQRFDAVDKRFDGIEGRIERIEGDVFNLKLGQEDLKTMFKANKEAVEKTHAELVAFRNEAKEKFDHLERQNKFSDRELQDVNLELANHNREIKKIKFDRE